MNKNIKTPGGWFIMSLNSTVNLLIALVTLASVLATTTSYCIFKVVNRLEKKLDEMESGNCEYTRNN